MHFVISKPTLLLLLTVQLVALSSTVCSAHAANGGRSGANQEQQTTTAAPTSTTTSAPRGRGLPSTLSEVVIHDEGDQNKVDVLVPESGFAVVAVRAPLSVVLQMVPVVTGIGGRACDEGFYVRVQRGTVPAFDLPDMEDDGALAFFSLDAMRDLVAGSTFCTGAPRLTVTVKDTGVHPACDDPLCTNGTEIFATYYILIRSRATPTASVDSSNGTASPDATSSSAVGSYCSATVYVETQSRTVTALKYATIFVLTAVLTFIFCREALVTFHYRDLIAATGASASVPIMSTVVVIPFVLTEYVLALVIRAALAFGPAPPSATTTTGRTTTTATTTTGRRQRLAADVDPQQPEASPLADAEMAEVRSGIHALDVSTSNNNSTSSAEGSPLVASSSDVDPPPAAAGTTVVSVNQNNNHSRSAHERVDVDVIDELTCRVCNESGSAEELIAPCRCAGSMRYVHPSCLQRWRVEAIARNPRYTTHCEVCQAELDRRVVPGQRAPKLARIVAGQGARLAVFTIMTFAFYIFLGVLFLNTVGRASCWEEWHQPDESAVFILFLASAGVAIYGNCLLQVALSGIVARAHLARIVAGDAARRRREDHGAEMPGVSPAAVAARTVCLALYTVVLGYCVTDVLWLGSAAVPFTMEFRVGNGVAVLLFILFVTWAAARIAAGGGGGGRGHGGGHADDGGDRLRDEVDRRRARAALPTPLLAADDAHHHGVDGYDDDDGDGSAAVAGVVGNGASAEASSSNPLGAAAAAGTTTTRAALSNASTADTASSWPAQPSHHGSGVEANVSLHEV